MPTNLRLSGSNPGDPREESDLRFNYNNLNQIICASTKLGGNQPIHYSSDGGHTWLQSSLPSVSGDVRQGDPAIDWTSDGTAWSLTIGISANLVIRCFKSTDGGATWTFDSTITTTQTSMDKESLWVDHSPTSPYRDNLYVVWHNGTPCFVAARNGPGGTWSAPIQVSGTETTGSSDGGDIKTNTFGDVFAFWPDTGGNNLFVAKSTDGGASFGAPVQIASTIGAFQIGVPAQDDRRVLIYVSGGAYRDATNNLVYATWNDLAGGAGCNAAGDEPGSNTVSTCKSRIWFTRSTDGGTTWEPARKINDQASLNDQFFQRLAVDDATGSLMVIYYDTVNDPNRIKTDIWMQFSLDNGVTWSGATQITSAETDETAASAQLDFQYGDYIGLTGFAGRFFACWTDRRSGGSEEIWGAPLAIPSISFVFGKSTFSQDEVSPNQAFNPAFYINVDGFTNESLGFNTMSDLSNMPANVPAITVSVDASLNVVNGLSATQLSTIGANLPTVTFGPLPISADDPNLNEELQSFFYPYTITFPSNPALSNLFGALNPHQVVFVTLSGTFTVGNVTVTAQALIEFAKGEDPYFQNLDKTNPKAYPIWLSYDVRFFKTTPSQMPLTFGIPNPTDASDCISYIQNVISYLNTPAAIASDAFDNTLSQNEDTSALEYLPADKSGNLTFNFAVARVRILANSSGTLPSPVRVFFRLFPVQSTATTFAEVGTAEGAYRWGTDGSTGHKIALMGVGTNQQGALEWTTVPCFAAARINLAPSNLPMNQQHDDANARTITTIAGQEVDTFFGCWLDLNQQGVQNQQGQWTIQPQQFLPAVPPPLQSQWDGTFSGSLVSLNEIISNAPHQCLVAEIRYDDTPVPPGSDTTDSDKLAQRNIAWIDGPNPGQDPSRVMPHPFEVRASSPAAREVDELLIFWGTTPAGSSASFYLPAVSAADVIALADRMYPAHRLSVIDAHTIGCPVGNATLIPIPKGVGAYAGLLAVDLPPGIRRGDRYDIVVRQITEATAFVAPPPPVPQIRLTRPTVAPANTGGSFSWRKTSGTFQVTITISTKEVLLYPEERLLAWLKWKLSVLPKSLRFYPVLQRYLGLIIGRVTGYGGKPGQIPPSSGGIIPGHPPLPHPLPPPHEDFMEFTGKVVSLIYDRFGDFAGFILRTEHGHEHEFKGREHAVEALVKSAWIERSVITVRVERHQHDWPASIVLRHYH